MIELGFWSDRIWAQDDNPLFTHGEEVLVDTTAMTTYQLSVVGDTYTLRGGGATLSGAVRDYQASSFPVYGTPNFLFLGDNTTSGGALARIAYVGVETGAATPTSTPTATSTPTPTNTAAPATPTDSPVTPTSTLGAPDPGGPWYNSAWQYRQRITIAGSQVSGSTTPGNFPLLVSSTLDDWRSTASGGKVGRADGGDILFTAADGTTKLDHEVERYEAASGNLVAWVRVPILTPGTDTDIYIYYGNAAATQQQNRVGVWSSAYRGVWHLNEPSPSSTGGADATANGSNGAPVGQIGQLQGKVGGNFDFTAAGNYLDHGKPAALQFQGGMTVSFWINPRAYTITGAVIGKQGGNGARSWVVRLDSFGGINFNVAVSSSSVVNAYSEALPLDTWSYVTAVYDPGVALRVYVDGVLHNELTAGVPAEQYDNGQSLLLGKRNGCSPCEIDSRIDEMRLEAVARSANWITTQFRNQSAPGSFYSFGQVAASSTNTPTPTSTPTSTPTNTPTNTPTSTNTATNTPTVKSTPTATEERQEASYLVMLPLVAHP